jgi:hypothetical protein
MIHGIRAIFRGTSFYTSLVSGHLGLPYTMFTVLKYSIHIFANFQSSITFSSLLQVSKVVASAFSLSHCKVVLPSALVGSVFTCSLLPSNVVAVASAFLLPASKVVAFAASKSHLSK